MEQPKLTAEFFKGNRQRLLKKLPAGSLAIIPAHRQIQRNGDVTFRFRQNSNFYYLSGINEPDCLLVIGESAELLIVPDKNKLKELWEGGNSHQQLSWQSKIKQIVEWKSATAVLRRLIKSAKHVYYPLPAAGKHLNFELDPAQRQVRDWLKRKFPQVRPRNIKPILAKLRMVKQPEEIDSIKGAIRVTAEAFRAVQQLIKPGVHEYQLAAKIGQVFWSHNLGEAFPIIVAAGKSACTIHYETGESQLRSGEMVLFDLGAEVNNYAADISRTIPVSGRFSARQRTVYEAVRAVQSQAMELLQPGIIIGEYEKQVARLMQQQLMKIKLLKKSSPAKAVRRYFPHGTSHFLGLDVHDVGDYRLPLEPGMVLTVEPGIYIPEEGIGVRIEDNVLITKTGIENLSSNVPVVQ